MYLLNTILLTASTAFLISLFFLILLNLKKIVGFFSDIGIEVWVSFVVVLIVSGLFRFLWVPHQQFIYHDGINFVNIARTIRSSGLQAICVFTSEGACMDYFFSFFWPPIYPLMISVLFRVFSYSQSLVFNFSALIGIFSVFISFLLSYLWTKKKIVALISATLFSFTPVILKFSGTSSLVLPFLFFALLATLFFELFLGERKKYIFLLFIVSLLCAAYTRIEGFLLVPVFIFSFIVRTGRWKNLREEISIFLKKKFYRNSIVVGFLLLVPIFVSIYVNRNITPQEGWTPGFLETINYLRQHSFENIRFLLDPRKNLLISTFLIISGLVYSAYKEKSKLLSFFVFFAGYFTLYSGFDMGNFMHRELVKYSLILFVPLFYFLSTGVDFFYKKLKEAGFNTFLIVSLFAVILGLNFQLTTDFVQHSQDINYINEVLAENKETISKADYVVNAGSLKSYVMIDVDSVDVPAVTRNMNYFKDKELILIKNSSWQFLKNDREDVVERIRNEYQFEKIYDIEGYDRVSPSGIFRMIRKE